jgi:hypothetical protein
MEVAKVAERIEQEAKNASGAKRILKTMKVGETIRQGDIYLVRIEALTESERKTLKPWKGQQLVRGTQGGARHMAEGAKLFESDRQRFKGNGRARATLLGPIVVADRRCTITHPEHAHFELPRGTYQVANQLDPRTMRAVLD